LQHDLRYGSVLAMLEVEFNFEDQSFQELLGLLLRSEKNAEAICKEFTVEMLADVRRPELGITKVAYQRLMAAIELGRRVHEAKSNYQLVKKISSSSDAIDFCRVRFSRLISDCLQEEFHIVTLNTKNHVIATHQITVGTLDASLVHPREVFRSAIKDAASSIILAHNHPSGDSTPSREDRAVTDRLTEVGKVIGIDVLDHIVMGKGSIVSVRESS
jgi:DNA repair protein RadC